MNKYFTFRTMNRARPINSNIQQGKNLTLYTLFTSQFMEHRNSLVEAKETFSQEQIWPDECDYILYKIRPLQKTANSVASLANSMKKGQGNNKASHNRYSLLVSAQYFCDQVDTLIDFVQEYKEVAENRSARKSKKKAIVSSLYTLDSSLNDLLGELDKTM